MQTAQAATALLAIHGTPRQYSSANSSAPAIAPTMPRRTCATTRVRKMPWLSGSSLRPGVGPPGKSTFTCAGSSRSTVRTCVAAACAACAVAKTAAALLLETSPVSAVSLAMSAPPASMGETLPGVNVLISIKVA